LFLNLLDEFITINVDVGNTIAALRGGAHDFIGSVSEAVAARAHCSVEVVRTAKNI